ncbi:MAG TPA: hypothetical protein GX510_04870 [Firmicutes bacterium]|nr:hypothetical protein [Candidatus Fermentithermobacillaceae bacterium]
MVSAECLVLVAVAVVAALDVLLSLRARSEKGWRPLVVILVTGNSANVVEGTVRRILWEDFKSRGMSSEIRALDLDSSDETPEILTLLERDGILSVLSPADLVDPDAIVLNLQDMRGREAETVPD